jgi:hypothetical protein
MEINESNNMGESNILKDEIKAAIKSYEKHKEQKI